MQDGNSSTTPRYHCNNDWQQTGLAALYSAHTLPYITVSTQGVQVAASAGPEVSVLLQVCMTFKKHQTKGFVSVKQRGDERPLSGEKSKAHLLLFESLA